ncbi:MAG: NUDIX hydrolase [Oscillospiraceae bacterium]|nr:NUDIX hydrolase [Ruminococcus sp.]MCD8346211.1 NUDIX hydrolase [Oscillospiraceae bacterium]
MELRDKNGLTEAEFLASYSPKNYPRPSLTADAVIFTGSKDNLSLLLIKRGGHPFLGCYALPGGFVNPNETVEQAARRELNEETGLTETKMSLVGVYSKPGRDPRTWVVSTAFYAYLENGVNPTAGDDASDAKLFTLEYQLDSDTCHFTLTNGEDKLSGSAKFSQDGMPTEITESQGLAFDHVAIIVDAIRKLQA